MKALVLAGGSGTRLRPFSHSMPKQLIPLANRPVLDHVLDNVRALGITEIGIIVGDRAEQIVDALGDGSRHGTRITYIAQDRPLGLAHAVKTARPFLGDDDFVMYLGDNILTEGITRFAEEFARNRPAAQVVVAKVADPRAFGVAELGPDGAVLRLVEKPERPRSDLALVGVYFFTRAVHTAIDLISPSARGELEITDAVQWLLTHGERVTAGEYDGFWRDTGVIEDVMACNRRLLEDLRTDVAGDVDSVSRLEGQVVIEPGARVIRSHIVGPAIIGPGTVVEDSWLGPDVAIGPNCAVRDASLADSIVLDGASITGVGLRRSLIGRCATVGGGDDRTPPRLIVGDHARVLIAA